MLREFPAGGGSEELPAIFVPKGMNALEKALTQLLKKEGIAFDTFAHSERLAD